MQQGGEDIFASADWYDRGINWDARLEREIPALVDVFGPPAEAAAGGGLLDAGCGSGRHLAALAKLDYRVTGLDHSPAMLDVARRLLADQGASAKLVKGAFVEAEQAAAAAGGAGFDGVYCLGNALAAVGNRGDAERSFEALAGVLRPGGRMFVQILNFERLRAEKPAVRGPRVRREGGCEYVSTRVYGFRGEQVEVTNVTLWREGGGWRQHVHGGTLYALTRDELAGWCRKANLTVDGEWGGYDRKPFDAASSNDLIVVATRG